MTRHNYRLLAEITFAGRRAFERGETEADLDALADRAMNIVGDSCERSRVLTSMKAGWHRARGAAAAAAVAATAIDALDDQPTRRQRAAICNLAHEWFTARWVDPAVIEFRVERSEYDARRLVVVGCRHRGHYILQDLAQWFIGPRGGLTAVDGGRMVRGRKAVRAGSIG